MDDQSVTPERAYNKGCMWGMSGGDQAECPYRDSALVESWQSGWQTGFDAFSQRRAASESVPL